MPFIFSIHMANTLWTIAKYWKAIFTKLDSGYNFLEQKDFVTHYVDREKQEKNNLIINWDTTRRYIGKIFKDPDKRSKKYYSDDFMIWSLKYLFEKTPSNWTVIVQIGPELSELMNWPEDVEDAMTQEEQKLYVQHIFDKYVNSGKIKKYKKKLKIVSFEENHKVLFSNLRDGKKEWDCLRDFKSKECPIILEDRINSFDIARYLHWVCHHNKAFFELIKGTKVKWVAKTDTNNPEYYWLIEIACRLQEFIQEGVYIQWWGVRQQNYDNIIRDIVHWSDKFPELKWLTNICQNKLSKKEETQQKFQWIYFDGDKNRDFIKKQRNAREIKTKAQSILYIVYWTWAALFTLFSYWAVSKVIEYNRVQKQIGIALENALKDQSVDVRFDNKPPMTVWKDYIYKREHLLGLSESLAERFYNQHNLGIFSDLTKQDIKLMALQLLTDHKLREIIDWEDIRYWTETKDYFIRNVLIPRYRMQFIKSWVNIDEIYPQYKKYEQWFINAMNYDQSKWEFKIDKKVIILPAVGEMDITDIDGIWDYYRGSVYKLWIYKKNWVPYLLAGYNTPLANESYNIDRWQDIAFDYFLQKNPIIEDIFNSFLLMYSNDHSYVWHNQQIKCYNDSVCIDSYKRDDLNAEIKRLVIRHFINTNSYKNWNDKQESINKYLERFAKDNQSKLMQLWFNLYPYKRFEIYKDAFQNSIDYYKEGDYKNDGHRKDDKLFVLTYKDFSDFNQEEYLWDYMLQNWDIFWLKVITYKWKRYIVWREISNPRIDKSWTYYVYDESYAIVHWKNVWEELLELIKNAKIKQILENKSKNKTDINKLNKEKRKRVYKNSSKP